MKITYLCPYCLEAIKSHGERFNILVNEDLEEHTTCDFCEEEDEDLTPITFQKGAIMKIKTLEAVYTGGGIWLFYGELKDGTFYLTDDYGCTIILNESAEDLDKSTYEDWQNEHKIKYLVGEEATAFLKELIERLETNNYSGACLSDSEIDHYKDYWLEPSPLSEEEAEEDPEPEEPKQVKIREFINLYNAELQKMFDGDEEAHIYGYDITLEWNGYKVNLGDGAIPTNALVPALEEMDSEYEGEMQKGG